MKATKNIIAVLIFVFFIGGIALTMAFNIWNTETTKIPAKIKSGELAGEYNPSDIRGSYTFADIEKSFGVTPRELGKAFGIERDDLAIFKCKELEDMFKGKLKEGEIETDSVRLFVALYKKIPYTPEKGIKLPANAYDILKDKALPSELEKFKNDFVDISEIVKADSASSLVKTETTASKSSEKTEPTAEDKTIKGKTTFSDLINWGVAKNEIEAVLKSPMGKEGEAIRDFLSAKGLEFSEYKTKLQDLVDKKK